MSSPDLSTQIKQILTEYTDDIKAGIEESAIIIGDEAVKKLKQISPEKTGKYKKGWTKSITNAPTFVKVVVYNRTASQLTHLLEFGHALSNGKRTKAIPHIKPTEAESVKRFEEEIKNVIRNGGK